jgi:D-glycero-alpha-D-manno-heptose-7-phosphate kinase
MVISRTPLWISFVGGGTDFPDFADQHGGAVVSTAIEKWIHVIVAPRFEGDVRVSYSKTEIVPTAKDVEHELVREALRLTGIPRGIEVVTMADVPSRGTGLGSSSSVMVGLLNALHAFQGRYRSARQLAQEASRVEIEDLGKPVGRQDQFAAALGGFNLIEFVKGGGVRAEPVTTPRGTLEKLHRSLLLFFTGVQRSADDVLDDQRARMRAGDTTEKLHAMRELAYEFRDALSAGDVDAVGELLHRNWELKRSLADGVTSELIDGAYAKAREAGATGGKLLGAGAGGFLLFFVPTDRQDAVRRALGGDLREVPFRFAGHGSQILRMERLHGP